MKYQGLDIIPLSLLVGDFHGCTGWTLLCCAGQWQVQLRSS